MRKLIVTGVAAACLTGCVAPKFYAQQVVDQLKPGVSTLGDATRLLGEPVASSAFDNGTLVHWIDIQGSIFRKHGAHLAIFFDGSDKMVRVTHKFDSN